MLSTTLESNTQIGWKWRDGEKVLCANGKQMIVEVGILISETKKTNPKIIQETKKDVMYL